jgi:hypothetical protein
MIEYEFQGLSVPYERTLVKLAARIVAAVRDVLLAAPLGICARHLALGHFDIAEPQD